MSKYLSLIGEYERKTTELKQLRELFLGFCRRIDKLHDLEPLSDSAYISDKQYKCPSQDKINSLYREIDRLAASMASYKFEGRSILKEAARSMLMLESE